MGHSPTQELNQKVCHKYGWSARFEKEEFWVCYVTVGLNDERRFVSADSASSEATEPGMKQGIAAASQAALDGLKEEIALQEAKPKLELTQVFPLYPPGEKGKQKPRFLIKGSSPANWNKYIWGPLSRNDKTQKPFVVGIDTEGNQASPPVLIQIATEECVLLEITSMLHNQISDNLRRLLEDQNIIKVFCDNYAHHDKRSLGLLAGNTADEQQQQQQQQDFSQGHIVDLEALTAKVLGPVKVARGLSRIVTLLMPELNAIVGKPPSSKGRRFKDIGRFTMIEQGKAPPLQSLRDLTRKEQLYAAMDAWATLQAYHRLVRDTGTK